MVTSMCNTTPHPSSGMGSTSKVKLQRSSWNLNASQTPSTQPTTSHRNVFAFLESGRIDVYIGSSELIRYACTPHRDIPHWGWSLSSNIRGRGSRRGSCWGAVGRENAPQLRMKLFNFCQMFRKHGHSSPDRSQQRSRRRNFSSNIFLQKTAPNVDSDFRR